MIFAFSNFYWHALNFELRLKTNLALLGRRLAWDFPHLLQQGGGQAVPSGSTWSGVPARPRSLAVFRLSVREARREFEDQFRGLPIELVDLKNKFLATSFRYQGISRGLLYSWWRLEDARWALKIDKTLLKSAIFIVFSSFGGVLNMKFDEEQLLFWCESCGRTFCGSKTRFKLWRRLKIPTKFWFRMWG